MILKYLLFPIHIARSFEAYAEQAYQHALEGIEDFARQMEAE